MDWKKLSTSFFISVYNRSIYKQCEICHDKSTSALCHYCKIGFEHNQSACAICQLPLNKSLLVCGKCQSTPPPYQRCIAPLRFEGMTKHLIHAIKFHQQAHYIRPLIELLRDRLLSEYKKDDKWPTQLLFVPSHPKRIKERGFCQTQLMANQLAQQLNQHVKQDSNAPTFKIATPNPIKKRLHTQAQHTLNKKLRAQNQTKAYRIESHIDEHVALLDDVMTTGSTLETCTKALLKNGAKQVDIWVLARTPDNKQ